MRAQSLKHQVTTISQAQHQIQYSCFATPNADISFGKSECTTPVFHEAFTFSMDSLVEQAIYNFIAVELRKHRFKLAMSSNYLWIYGAKIK